MLSLTRYAEQDVLIGLSDDIDPKTPIGSAMSSPGTGAAPWVQRLLAVRKRVLGEEHPDTLTSVNNLAVELWLMGERIDAVDLMKTAVDGQMQALGQSHPDSRSSIDDLTQMEKSLTQEAPGRG